MKGDSPEPNDIALPPDRDESLAQIAAAVTGMRLDLTAIREMLAGGR